MVVVTEWVRYQCARSAERLKREMAQPVVVDLRNIYRPEDMAAHGFTYEDIGRQLDRVLDAPTHDDQGFPAWPGFSRPSSVFSFSTMKKTWMPGARPGMDVVNRVPQLSTRPSRSTRCYGELARTLAGPRRRRCSVAPPGAGKTTRVPLALLDAPWLKGKKIIMLEPRRIAARASAERMARTLGERAGETVGYRVRFGSKVSRATRIEVVTEGIFSRQILDDPELSGVAAVLFDEFTSVRSMPISGLALARDAQTGLREDLRILVMSATLDGARVGKLLGDAPVVASEGRAFPVETRYLGRKADAPIERQMADAIAAALRADPGSVLAFLPGAAEIRRTQNFLGERCP